MATPSIIDLASTIQTSTKTIQEFLTAFSAPALSFDANAFPFFPGTGPAGLDQFSTPSAILAARSSLRQACETLLQLTTSPAEQVIIDICRYHTTTCLQYVHHFKIAEAVPASYRELASRTNQPESQIKRIIRYLMTHNYFQESNNTITHTAGSKLLITMRSTVGYVTGESFHGGPKICEAAEQFQGSEERNHSSWNLGHGIDKPFFEFLEINSIRRARFLDHMNILGGSEGWNIKHLVNGFDWKSLDKGSCVDIGGSVGHAALAIAEASELHFIVQDLEKCSEDAKAHMAKQGKVSQRVEFQVHNFFEMQPIQDADAYLLRYILHDYPDKYAAKILQNIVPAMGKQSRIVVMDGIVPDPGVLTKVDERQFRLMDMEMMLTYNAVERDLEAWKALFEKADPRLELKNIVTPPGSAQSVMEVVLKNV